MAVGDLRRMDKGLYLIDEPRLVTGYAPGAHTVTTSDGVRVAMTRPQEALLLPGDSLNTTGMVTQEIQPDLISMDRIILAPGDEYRDTNNLVVGIAQAAQTAVRIVEGGTTYDVFWYLERSIRVAPSTTVWLANSGTNSMLTFLQHENNWITTTGDLASSTSLYDLRMVAQAVNVTDQPTMEIKTSSSQNTWETYIPPQFTYHSVRRFVRQINLGRAYTEKMSCYGLRQETAMMGTTRTGKWVITARR